MEWITSRLSRSQLGSNERKTEKKNVHPWREVYWKSVPFTGKGGRGSHGGRAAEQVLSKSEAKSRAPANLTRGVTGRGTRDGDG